MARTGTIDQISRQANGSYVGVWGRYLLCSAFQPIFALVDGKFEITAYEGLIRPFENGRQASPAELFASIRAIDRFGVETLTRNLHVLNAVSVIGDRLSLYLNFDPSVFTDRAISDGALRDLKLALHESGIDPGRVVCELTEQKSASDETMYDFVRSLRQNGFRIALDDYGADESDFRRVREIKPDIVKFDRSWIVRLMGTAPGVALLSAMVQSFKDMGVATLFEGLEETWQLETAEHCGVEMVQGFILGLPQLVAFEGAGQEFPQESDEASSYELEPPHIAYGDHAKPVSHGKAARPFGRRVATS